MHCYEYFNCPKKNCPAYTSDDSTPCWKIEGTLCHNSCRQILKDQGRDERAACELCLYYLEKIYYMEKQR